MAPKPIKARASITAAEKQAIERHQFDKLLPDDETWLDNLSIEYNNMFNGVSDMDGLEIAEAENIVERPGLTLNYEELSILMNFKRMKNFHDCMDGHEFGTTVKAVIEGYFHLFAREINNIRSEGDDTKLPSVGVIDSEILRPYEEHAETDTENTLEEELKRDKNNWMEIARCVLRDMAPEKFRNNREVRSGQSYDFILTPYLEEGHYLLFGIAVKDKFVFRLDSANLRLSREQRWLHTLHFAIGHFVEFFEGGSLVLGESWPLYRSWLSRSNPKTPGQRLVAIPRQADMHNCGIFTTTNAFCLSYGYDLLCYQQADLPLGKRPRMAVELRDGVFRGEYEYEALDYPRIDRGNMYPQTEAGKEGAAADPGEGRAPPEADDEEQRGLGMSEQEKEAFKARGELYTADQVLAREKLPGGKKYDSGLDDMPWPANFEEANDEDEQEKLEERNKEKEKKVKEWMAKDKARKAKQQEKKAKEEEGKRKRPRTRKAIAEEKAQEEAAKKQAKDEKEKGKGKEKEKEKEKREDEDEDEGEEKVEISSCDHTTRKLQRVGFIYKTPEVNWRQDKKYTREELVQACRDFPLVGWTNWNKQPLELFQRWMLSEMGAVLARIHQEKTHPVEGVGKGYEVWKKWKEDGEKKKDVAPKTKKKKTTKGKVTKIKATATRTQPTRSLRRGAPTRLALDATV